MPAVQLYTCVVCPAALSRVSADSQKAALTAADLGEFFDYALGHQDVWFVTHSQLLDWMEAPVPASQVRRQLGCRYRRWAAAVPSPSITPPSALAFCIADEGVHGSLRLPIILIEFCFTNHS